MTGEEKFYDLETFIQTLKKSGIKKVAFAYTDETRATAGDADQVEVKRVIKADILAYKSGVIYKYSDMDNINTYNRMINEGFEVGKFSRNIS